MLILLLLLLPSRNYLLEVGKSKDISVIYQPKESAEFRTKLTLFMENSLSFVQITGQAGSLILETDLKYVNGIQFGTQPENSTVWVYYFLTNNGSLPLKLESIVCKSPKLLKLYFLEKVQSRSVEHQNIQMMVKPDYWRMVRSRITRIIHLKNASVSSAAITVPTIKNGLNLKYKDEIVLPIVKMRPAMSKKTKPLLPVLEATQVSHHHLCHSLTFLNWATLTSLIFHQTLIYSSITAVKLGLN